MMALAARRAVELRLQGGPRGRGRGGGGGGVPATLAQAVMGGQVPVSRPPYRRGAAGPLCVSLYRLAVLRGCAGVEKGWAVGSDSQAAKAGNSEKALPTRFPLSHKSLTATPISNI